MSIEKKIAIYLNKIRKKKNYSYIYLNKITTYICCTHYGLFTIHYISKNQKKKKFLVNALKNIFV